MKKGLSAIFILGLALFLNAPLQAQKTIGKGKTVKVEKTATRYGKTAAYSDGNGVFVEWETLSESDNLGFNIYRISGDNTERINKSLVAGGYLRGESNSSGSYSFFDADGDLGSVYYIESLDLKGRLVNSQMLSPESVEDLTAVAGISSAQLKKSALASNPDSLQLENDLPDDLKAEVSESAPQADPVTQRFVASQPGVKIGITKEGFYRITRAQLQAAGFDVNAAPALWQLYVNGVQQSINVGTGATYIEFYGRGIDTPEADTQIYYLIVGAQNGKRISPSVRRATGGQVLSRSFTQSLTKKERFNYATAVLNGDKENYFGTILGSTATTVNFNLLGVDFSVPTSSVDIGLQGLTDISHRTTVVLNGKNIGNIVGNFKNLATRHYDIPTSLLLEGVNTLQFTTLDSIPGGLQDYSLFESVKVSYARRYQAEQNQLSFYTNNYRANYLEGFSSPNVRIFDITNPDNPMVISGLTVEANGGSYRVFLPASRGRVMFAIEDSAFSQAASINANSPSALSTATHNADLVIISYKDWITQANDWADYRRSQGITVEVVNIEDVFDEFNFGVIDSLSIRSFLKFAKTNWQTGPRYALLLGDTTYDPKNHEKNGNFNFVPSKLVDSIYGEMTSDDTLADFNDDGLAELAIGRIPARSSADVTQLLNKTKVFEQTSATAFSRGLIFASDYAPADWDFIGTSNRLRDLLPSGTASFMVNRAEIDAKTKLLNELNNGRYFINFAGHGTSGAWNGNFFTKTDALAMTNGNNLSIFTLLTCLNGKFNLTSTTDSLAESLLKAQNGGAAAVWASTGETTPDIQEVMATRFYQQLTLGNIKRLGDLVNDAKTVVNAGLDVRLSWALLGDPMLKVR